MQSSWPRDSLCHLERERCRRSLAYFAGTYCKILASKDSGDWVPFALWPAQVEVASQLQEHKRVCQLKARQLGFSWLAVALALWRSLSHPIATVLLFSKRDDEAVELLTERLRGMYDRLPPWLRPGKPTVDNDHEFGLANGSRVMAFPTTGGRSYTGTLVIVDEADYVPDLAALLNAVKPTVDAGGQLVLLSTPDKSQPESLFKAIYRAGKAGTNGYLSVFQPWNARPDRTQDWYEQEKQACLANTGSLDDLHQEYPETDAEALSPRTLDKRLAPAWLERCYREQPPLTTALRGLPSIPGLEVFAAPLRGRTYVLGADTAEGNPQSDESACEVLDEQTGEQVARFAGRFEPSVFASYVDALGVWYNHAAALYERNNHGHACLLWAKDHGSLKLLRGLDDKPGWHSTTLGKARLYDACADAFRNGEVSLHSLGTFTQLASIEGATLRAPEGQRDDRADAFALACVARVAQSRRGGPVVIEKQKTLTSTLPRW